MIYRYAVIRLERASKDFDRHPVLRDVSLEVPAGGTLALVGEGGSGKSLVLKLICGLLRPDRGSVFVGGREVSAMSETALMAVRRGIGMIFQNYALFDYLDVGENIAFPLRQLGTHDEAAIQSKVQRRLEQVHLPGIERLMPSELSGGMKKRVCLARATVHDPPIMLCDDPTAGLDPVTTNRIFGLLKGLQEENQATVIIVSHEVDYLKPIAESFAMLQEGALVFAGPVEAAAESPNPAVRAFLA